MGFYASDCSTHFIKLFNPTVVSLILLGYNDAVQLAAAELTNRIVTSTQSQPIETCPQKTGIKVLILLVDLKVGGS